ncbi:helix-turn-helix domain-containing protein [Ralstonia flatus]|uniref:helix-turn-helix domain-containing protein n=1 Tax=Ralstonia flatus TaxID=3058601 RepID=UPI00292FDDDA|nr:helix-turn-helix transcriptional regulator [Ralstonia sp. LMG 32965]
MKEKMMRISGRYKDAFKRARQSPEYWTERALLELSRQFVEAMKQAGLTQKALAERLEKKPSFLSRVFGARSNVTVSTASQIAHALDMHLEINLAPNTVLDRKTVFSVTSREEFVPKDGVVVKSHRLRLVKGANESLTASPSPVDQLKAA